MGQFRVYGELITGFNRFVWGPSAMPPFWATVRPAYHVEALL